jgi:hypothetical protein
MTTVTCYYLKEDNQELLNCLVSKQMTKNQPLAGIFFSREPKEFARQIANLVEQAAQSTFKDWDSYKEGKKKLTRKQLKQIKSEFAHHKAILIASHNLGFLHTLVAEKAKNFQVARAETEKMEQLVAQAAVTVLKHMSSYKSGTAIITDEQKRRIEHEFEKLHEALQHKMRQQAKEDQETVQLYEDLVTRIRKSKRALQDKSLLADYYQVMGCVVSYGSWKEGDVIKGPIEHLDYKVHKVVTNDRGLQVVVLIPKDDKKNEALPPILCCRGTVSDSHNLIDDLNPFIGQHAFRQSRDEIADILKKMTPKYGSAVITGHSLGGAIAQAITTEFCDKPTSHSHPPLIKAVYHFNAPGIGPELVQRYEEKMSEIPAARRPLVYSYYHAGDVVALAGGAHLPPTEEHILGKASLLSTFKSPMKSIKEAHSWTQLISEFGTNNIRKVASHSHARRFMRVVGEKVRQLASFFFKGRLLHRITTEAQIKAKARKLHKFSKMSSQTRNIHIRHKLEQKAHKKEKAKEEARRVSEEIKRLSLYYRFTYSSTVL